MSSISGSSCWVMNASRMLVPSVWLSSPPEMCSFSSELQGVEQADIHVTAVLQQHVVESFESTLIDAGSIEIETARDVPAINDTTFKSISKFFIFIFPREQLMSFTFTDFNVRN